ncbi:MAG: hypothetical protein ICV73_25210 [Acetobacteraceae bacterium]|nr:hypothetical protein [Acetobacteraceae bacterium]
MRIIGYPVRLPPDGLESFVGRVHGFAGRAALLLGVGRNADTALHLM